MHGRRSATCGRRGREDSEHPRHEGGYRADLLEPRRQRSGSGQNRLRGMSQRMKSAGAMAEMAERAFRLFHLGPHGVQVVAGRNHGKQQNQRTAESANEGERARRTIRRGRRNSSPPQQPRGQQQGEPAEIKKKLHTKCPGPYGGDTTTWQNCLKMIRIIRIAQRQQLPPCVPASLKAATDPAGPAKVEVFEVSGGGWLFLWGFQQWHRHGSRIRRGAACCRRESERWRRPL